MTPRFEVSDHPEYSFCWGEAWTTKVVNAIMESPMGGDRDLPHMGRLRRLLRPRPPPHVDVFGLGIRAPMLVISPYSKHGHVSHELAEFSSPVRFIEDNWGLPQLAERDRRGDAAPRLVRLRPAPPAARPATRAPGLRGTGLSEGAAGRVDDVQRRGRGEASRGGMDVQIPRPARTVPSMSASPGSGASARTPERVRDTREDRSLLEQQQPFHEQGGLVVEE